MNLIEKTSVTRRQFIKSGTLGLTAVAVGSAANFSLFPNKAYAQVNGTINLGMTTSDVEMVDGILVPHWVYSVAGNPTLPGPAIFAFVSDTIHFNITNNIAGVSRRFAIVGNDFAGDQFALIRQSGNIPFGETRSLTINANSLEPGTYLYKDPTLDPISRVLGLHGVLIILPDPLATNPYGVFSTPNVTSLFNALGVGIPRDPEAIFPGQPWFATTDANIHGYHPDHNDSEHRHHEQFILAPNGPQSEVFERFLYRTRIWLHSSIDPELNRAVITNDTIPDPATVKNTFLPQYFSINGRQGGFSMHSPDVIPVGTVGEPHVIRLLNAGLATHSPHLHANHFYVISVNNQVGGGGPYFGNAAGDDNVLCIDTINLGPEDRIDWVVPFIRPPDIPRVLGNDGLLLPLAQLAAEEIALTLIPPQHSMSWPMHSHMELDQTAAGGNYPQGAIAGWDLTGEFGKDFIPHAGGILVPIAINDFVTTPVSVPVTINVLANDTFDGQPVNPALATVTLVTNVGGGNAVLNGDNTFTYTPNQLFAGIDTFTYTVTVNGQTSNTAMVSVSVAQAQSGNRPPAGNNRAAVNSLLL